MKRGFFFILLASLLIMTACAKRPFDWQDPELKSRCIGITGAACCEFLVDSGAVKVIPGQGQTPSNADKAAKQQCREQMPPW